MKINGIIITLRIVRYYATLSDDDAATLIGKLPVTDVDTLYGLSRQALYSDKYTSLIQEHLDYDDCLQECVAKLWRCIIRRKLNMANKNCYPYLRTVAYHALHDMLRRHVRGQEGMRRYLGDFIHEDEINGDKG